ncbi:MAG TPA: class I SAM-dependent methyltransferase, partial [Oryzihumus sp.]|nr:class I SAM-dependent methyltransferase [Oryzihumus sp.]
MTPSPAPPVPLPDLVPSLRADLAAAGFTVEGIAAALGPVANEALGREQMLPADLATRDAGTPLATLVRLFTLGRPVPADAVSAALPTLGLEGLQRLGLVTAGEGQVRATCDLHPHADEAHSWWVASDLSEMATGAALAPDHVLGIGGASTTLAAWTPRPRVDRALDMGTGCGVQALHLSGHAGSTVATDLSRRALDFAAFNAAVNGLELDLRCGSLFEPVAGQRFQLIVSNPPFVITPRVSDVPLFEYRDGGLAGDALIEAVVRTIGEHLEPGGIGQFLGNWEVAEGADWRDRVRGWLEGTGLDAWVIQRDVQDPAQYAELWARDGGHVPG